MSEGKRNAGAGNDIKGKGELHFAHFVHCKNEIDESAVMELDDQIETKPQFTEILNDCIDIDDPSSFGGQSMNDTSSFFVQLPDSAETVNQNSHTPPNEMQQCNEMQQWDWSNRIIHPTTRDSSQSQPPITTTSYETPINSMKQMLQYDWSIQTAHHPPVKHLYSDGSDFSDASETSDEPIIPRRQKASNVIESSDDDNDAMDISFESGITLGNVSAVVTQEQTPAPSASSSPQFSRRSLPDNLSDSSGHSDYVSLLEELKNYRWNENATKTEEEKTMERKRMAQLCSQLSDIAPSKVLKKMFKTNSTKLADYVDIFPSKLIKEGDDCLCDEGELGNCKRFIWNCQWAYHSQSKGFCAQRNRCVIGSRIVYGVSNQIVIDELAAGLRCSLKSCLRRLLDGHFINNPDGGNTRFCSNICLNAYLKKMKDDAEKSAELRRTVPAEFNKGVASNMSVNTSKRGGVLSPEEARAIWFPLIAIQKNCLQCGVSVIELSEHGHRQASPQRPDPSILSYSNGNCAVFCLFCQMFNLDTPDVVVRQLLVEIAANSDPDIRLPSDWTPGHPIPPLTIPINAPVDEDYLSWLDVHLGTSTSVGKWFSNEEAKKTTNRDITVTRDYMIQLWKDNGGSYCRLFGVKGSWVPGNQFLLTIDKIDPTLGYVDGNLMIVLVRANNGKAAHPVKFYSDLLVIRDNLLTR